MTDEELMKPYMSGLKLHNAEDIAEIEKLRAERDAAVKLLQELRSWHLNGNDDSEGRELIDAYLKARGEK